MATLIIYRSRARFAPYGPQRKSEYDFLHTLLLTHIPYHTHSIFDLAHTPPLISPSSTSFTPSISHILHLTNLSHLPPYTSSISHTFHLTHVPQPSHLTHSTTTISRLTSSTFHIVHHVLHRNPPPHPWYNSFDTVSWAHSPGFGALAYWNRHLSLVLSSSGKTSRTLPGKDFGTL